MYDNISLKTVARFANTVVFDDFCNRFLLVARDDRGQKLDNYSASGLSQNYGIRVAYETNTASLRVEFSLHKYWNAKNGRGQTNHNLFSVTDALVACLELVVLFRSFGVDLALATVQAYEYGLNVPITHFATTTQLLELLHDGYTYDGRVKRLLLKDRRQAGLVGTVINKNVRSVYVLYDKQKEVKEKTAQVIAQTMRVEAKHKRVQNKSFSDLFTDRLSVIKQIETELTTAFSDGLYFNNFALPYFERVVRDIDLYGSAKAAKSYYGELLSNRLIHDSHLKQYAAAMDKYKGYETPKLTNDEKIFRALVLAALMAALV